MIPIATTEAKKNCRLPLPLVDSSRMDMATSSCNEDRSIPAEGAEEVMDEQKGDPEERANARDRNDGCFS